MFFPGYAFAATAGVRVVDGLSVEADVLRTSRNSNEPAPLTPYSLTSTSVMVDAKYTAALNDMFSVYGGVGVGWIRIDNSLLLPDFYSGLGYQLIGGVAAQVADHVSLVGEARFQSTFAPAVYSADPDYVISAPTATVMVGVKVGF